MHVVLIGRSVPAMVDSGVPAGDRVRNRPGRLAQLVRASPLQGEGRGFESLSAHQNCTKPKRDLGLVDWSPAG